jgi:serine phosphatase RsbU (regulator of sigma subunit)
VLTLLNEAILREESGDRFLTAVFCRLEPSSRGARLVLARGGHLPPLLWRPDDTFRPLGRPGLLLGSLPDVNLVDETVDLQPGDVVVLCTDGVTEARGANEVFGFDRLRELVAATADHGAAEIAHRIKEAALEFQAGAPRDDVAVLVLRVTGT